MFGWKNRRKTSKSASTTTAASSSNDDTLVHDHETLHRHTNANKQKQSSSPVAATSDSPPLPHRRRSLSYPTSSPSTTRCDIWSSDGVDIGITNISVSHRVDARRAVLLYEISLRFPALDVVWLVHRAYAEFAALHAALECAFASHLHARKIRLPRAARLSWESFRASVSADAAATRKLLTQLNTYVHTLVAIDVVHTSDVFQTFFTPRADGRDVEYRGRLLPPPLSPTSPVAQMVPLRRTQRLPALTARAMKLKRAAPLSTVSVPSISPPVQTAPVVATSRCPAIVHFGSTVQFTALGGLAVGLTRRSALSGSHKAVAVAAAAAGVALTGPLSAVFALGAIGGGWSKYQLNKADYLGVRKPCAVTASTLADSNRSALQEDASTAFVVENASTFSGPRRAVQFGDAIHLFQPQARKSVRIGLPPDAKKRGHLMIATADRTHAATLRLVSPFGLSGRIPCGSHVYLQVVQGDWAGEVLGVYNERIASGTSPTVFTLTTADDEHACPDAAPDAPVSTPTPTPFTLRVMAYNVWLFPGLLSSFNDKLSPFALQRAHAIPACVAHLNVDVVVFCEAFCAAARDKLVTRMKAYGFLFETNVVGAGASLATKKALDGGCFAMSKYPIECVQELTFGCAASGDDRMADKGVVYFTVQVDAATRVHVFGTHLQAWETPVAVAARTQQLTLVRAFMDAQAIPSTDAVLVVGDLNVNKSNVTDVKTSEYHAMLATLQVTDPELAPHSSAFSFDPTTNAFAVAGPSSSGTTERLDYVLVAQHHRLPVQATTEIVPLKVTRETYDVPQNGAPNETLVDLSDHYPVVSELRF